MNPFPSGSTPRRLALAGTVLALVVAAAVLLWPDGRSDLLEAPAPTVSSESEEPEPLAVSSMAVPMTIPLDILVGLLEDAVPRTYGSLDERQSLPDRGRTDLAFELERQPFHAVMDGNVVRIETLVEYGLQAWYDPPVLPELHGTCGTGDGPRPRLRMVLEAPLSLTEDWSLATRADLTTLEPASDEDRDRCQMTFLDFDVTGRVVDGARGFLEGHERTLDSLAASVELRSSFESWWETLRDPIELDESVWLVLRPEAVRRGPIAGTADSVRVALALEARPSVVVGARPARDTASLPPLRAGPTPPGIDILVEGRAEYGTASRFLQQELAGTELERQGRRIRIESLRVLGLGEGRVALEVRVSGDLRARLYLTGTPTLDRDGQVIAVPDLDFDVATENVVVQAASWLRGLGLLQLLRERARWPARPAEAWLSDWLRRGLNRDISSTLRIRGTVESLTVEEVRPLTADVWVRIEAKADARVLLIR